MNNQEHFTPEQISHMLSLQDELNSLIHPQWKEQGFEWNIAALAELVEIKEWLGWKWWKKGYQQGLVEENKKQVQIEVIDILHFWLSEDLKYGMDISYTVHIAKAINKGMEFGSNIYDAVKSSIKMCAEDEGVEWGLFGYLLKSVDLSPSQVYEIYLGKYTLNIFRQKHGYKDGTYKKHWLLPAISIEFQEDNWYLEKALADIKEAGHTVSIEEIDNRLEYWYGILEGGK